MIEPDNSPQLAMVATPLLIAELARRHSALLVAGVLCNELTGPNPANFFQHFGSKAECLGLMVLASDYLRTNCRLGQAHASPFG